MDKLNETPLTENTNTEQVQRIRHFEEIFDKVSAGMNIFNSVVEQIQAMYPEIEELTAYYESAEWKQDFADDESGKLPASLKRGVLSEDGIYNLLEQINELKEIL